MAWRARRFRFRFRRRRVNRTDSLSEATRKTVAGTLYILLGGAIYAVVVYGFKSIPSTINVMGVTIDIMLFAVPVAGIVNLLFLFKGVRMIGVRL